MTFVDLYKKSGISVSYPTFKNTILNTEKLKSFYIETKNGKKQERKTYLILDENKILDFFKA